MKQLFFVLTILITQNLFCQDSIHKKNGDIIAAKVLEISDSEVKFKKAENLNGPTYAELKSGLLYIKFENGTIDTIKNKVEIDPQVVTQKISAQPVIKKQSLMYVRKDNELFTAIEILPPSDARSKLKREYALMKMYKQKQYLANGLGMSVGFVVPVVASSIVVADLFNGNGNSFVGRNGFAVIVAGAVVGAAIRITGQVFAKVNKNKRINARKNIVRMYDELN